MNQKKPLQEQSKVRTLLIQAEFALRENRFEEAFNILLKINVEEMATLSLEELQAIGSLLNYLKVMAEEKKSSIVEQLKTIQVSKHYSE